MAVDRLTPTAGPMTGTNYAAAVNEEVNELWNRAVCTLTSVAGTNTITATLTPALTGSLQDGMMFILKPAATNTSTVTLNINGGGAVAVRDAENTALTAGVLRINANYLLKYDSTFTAHVIVGYIPAATLSPGRRLIATCAANSVPSNMDFFNGATPGVGSGGTGTVTASGTVVFDDTYDSYEFVISDLRPSTNDVELWIRVGTGGTPTYQVTLYDWAHDWLGTGGTNHRGTTADTKIIAAGGSAGSDGVGSATTASVSMSVITDNPESTALYKAFYFSGVFVRAADTLGVPRGGGFWKSATAITAVRFMFESGTIAAGRISMYGVTKS